MFCLNKSDLFDFFYYKQREARKTELETNLAHNLKMKIHDLRATIASIEDDIFPSSDFFKTQELNDAELSVDEVTNELESVCPKHSDLPFGILL